MGTAIPRGADEHMMNVRTIFDQHGLRCTRQREQVYLALTATDAHPTAEELFQLVGSANREGGCCEGDEAGLSLATVYNALEAFTGCGLVRRLPCPSGSGACRFDADTSEHVHLATEDGRLVDVPADLSEKLLSRIPADVLGDLESRMGVRVRGVVMQVVAGYEGNGGGARGSGGCGCRGGAGPRSIERESDAGV